MKACRFCAEEIQDDAQVCRFCGRDQGAGAVDAVGVSAPLVDPRIVAVILVLSAVLGLLGGFATFISAADAGGSEESLWGLFTREIESDVGGAAVVLAPGALALAIGLWAGARPSSSAPTRAAAGAALGAGLVWLLLTVGWGEAFESLEGADYGIGFWLIVAAGAAEAGAGIVGLYSRRGASSA